MDSGNPLFLTSFGLSRISSIRHGFFTRTGGVSGGIFSSLNCGLGSGDRREYVVENRRRVRDAVGAEHLCTLYQHHSADVVRLGRAFGDDSHIQGDAMVTATPGIALGILTADCVPVLFADPAANVVAAAHAGWKGAKGGIIQNTLKVMTQMGAQPSRIVAAIGPCIAQKSYEVGTEFYEGFLKDDSACAEYFVTAEAAGKYRFDLTSYVAEILRRAGVVEVDILGRDTCSEPDHFFSYRRTCLRGEKDYGRQISVIACA